MSVNLRYRLHQIKHRLGLGGPPELYFVVPEVNWVLDWVGYYITREMPRFGLAAHMTSKADKLVGQIIHFGSIWDINAFTDTVTFRNNHVVGTIFHGQRDIPAFSHALERLLAVKHNFLKLHTASNLMADRLKEWGIPEERLVCIPLGVDLTKFRPASPLQKRIIRDKLGIPRDVFVVGSFQKDGVGMEAGLTPKMIKGPDILLATIERLKTQMPIFVYLTAPARGYVIQGLEKLGVPYRHDVFEDYERIAEAFWALDAYLVSSREEGGPQGVLEGLASGVPIVSTKVGLAPDVIEHQHNGLLAEVEDSTALADHLIAIAGNPKLARKFSANGLEIIQAYDWSLIAARYYQQIYAPVLAEFT